NVEELAVGRAETPIFAVTDAWGRRDVRATLRATESLLDRSHRPRSGELIRVVASMVGHVGRVRKASRLADEGVRSSEIASRLKMHPFVAEKSAKQAGNFSPDELAQATVRLAELDAGVKGGSRLPPELQLERTLVEITGRAGESAGGGGLLLRGAGDELRRLRLPPRDRVPVESAARRGPVEPLDELAVPRVGLLRVALGDRLVQAAHERLRGRAPAEVLLPLPRRLANALLLLLDVGHLGKRPAARGRGDGSNPAPYAAPVEDAERQRHERRLERDRRRREQGKPAYFESDATLDSWPISQDPATAPT